MPNATYSFKSTAISAVRLMARAIVAVKETLTSDIFRLLESQGQNLEIVYANIRV